MSPKHRLVQSKEEYESMVAAWKNYHNREGIRGCIVEEKYVVRNHWGGSRVLFINRKKVTPLSGYHYILYNIFRDRPPWEGVIVGSDKTIFKCRLRGDTLPVGYRRQTQKLFHQLSRALYVNQKEKEEDSRLNWSELGMKWKREAIEEISRPFGKDLTERQLGILLPIVKDLVCDGWRSTR
jgi:hypothetical protein